MELKRDLLSPERYQYLDREESRLYDSVKDSDDPKDKTIKKLLEDAAATSRAMHCASRH